MMTMMLDEEISDYEMPPRRKAYDRSCKEMQSMENSSDKSPTIKYENQINSPLMVTVSPTMLALRSRIHSCHVHHRTKTAAEIHPGEG